MRNKNFSITKNKKRIISLLLKEGELTKRQLAEMGQMGWATVVKVINQLMEEGIVRNCGVSEDSIGQIGKDAKSFALVSDKPLAIGIDIEIRKTRIVLINLNGDILAEGEYKTAHPVDLEGAKKFLKRSISDFISAHNINMTSVDGIGIGKIGMTFPICMHVDEKRLSREIAAYLSGAFKTLVRIESNTKVYAMFKKWASEKVDYRDFLLVTIRTGVGTGIVVGGNLYTGTYGLSGEIAHMRVVPDGFPCRCGGSGCMETVVNQYYLYQQYRKNVLKDTAWSLEEDVEKLHAGLADLFSRAKAGEVEALEIVKTTADYLGQCIANAIAVLDIPNIIVSAHFGADGDLIESLLVEKVRNNVLANMEFTIQYLPFEQNGWVRGAALLILKDYLTDVVSESISVEYNDNNSA